MSLLYRGVKRLSTSVAVCEVQPVLLPTISWRCTFDRRRKDLAGRTARLTVNDQQTVSHRGNSRTIGVRHLVKRDDESTSTVRSQRSHHSSALHARIFAVETIKCIQIKVPALL